MISYDIMKADFISGEEKWWLLKEAHALRLKHWPQNWHLLLMFYSKTLNVFTATKLHCRWKYKNITFVD